MFLFPLLPPIPLLIYKQLNSLMVIMAGFKFFQFATVIWLEIESQLVALYLQLAEHQAPLQHCSPIPSTAGCYGSSAVQRSEGLGDAGGTIHHLRETYQCSLVNLYRVQFYWDWVVIYPLLSGNHEDYDFCFLWGCAGRRDFIHLDPFPSLLHCSIPLVFLYVVGQYFFSCFAMFFSGR